MQTLTVSITDEEAAALQKTAQEIGIAPEELVRRSLDRLLDRPNLSYEEATEYLLSKNTELYKRLA